MENKKIGGIEREGEDNFMEFGYTSIIEEK